MKRLNLTSASAGAVRIKSVAPDRVPEMRWLHGPRFVRLVRKFERAYGERLGERRGRPAVRPLEVRVRNALTYIFAYPLSWRVVARDLSIPSSTLQGDVAKFEEARLVLGRFLVEERVPTPALILKYLTVPQAKRREQAEARKELIVKKVNAGPPLSGKRKGGILRKIDKLVVLLDVEGVKQECRWRVEAGKLLDAGRSWEDVATKYEMTLPEARRRLEPSLGDGPPRWTHMEFARLRLEGDPDTSLVEMLREARQLATPATYQELAIVLYMPVVSVHRLIESLGIEGKRRTPKPPRAPHGQKGIPARPAELTDRLLETSSEREERLYRQWEPYYVRLSMARLWDDAGYPAKDFGPWAAIPLRPSHLEWIRKNRPDLKEPELVDPDRLNLPRALGPWTDPEGG